MRRLLVFILIICFLGLNLPAFGYTQISAYLCELGITFFQQGNYAAALHEFNKALMAQPDYPLALEYIERIRQKAVLAPEEAISPPPPPPVNIRALPESRAGRIKGVLDKIEKQRQAPISAPPSEAPSVVQEKAVAQRVVLPQTLILDENIKNFIQPFEIEQGKSVIIQGRNILRFLVTTPNVLEVESKSPDELLVTGKDIGYTYLHIWDARDRWTLQFLTTPAKPEGPTLEEQMRLEEEKAGTFKLHYYFGWSSFEQGRRVYSLKRQSYGYSHGLRLEGQTPYGEFDSSLTIRSLEESTDLTFFSFGLTKARLGQFKDFSLRGFDYSTDITNLVSPTAGLRGVIFKSPAFDNKIDYTLFWGREGGGRYGNLSPGIPKAKDSFLSGFGINYSPLQKQDYRFSVFHGWGRDRPDVLNPYGYDLGIDYHFSKLGIGYEVANDSEAFAHLFNATYNAPKLRLTTEFRDTDKNFKTMTGFGWRVGELGLLSTVSYVPFAKLNISGRLDVFQDRLFPNPESHNRWNEAFNGDAVYAIDPLTSLRLDYSLQNEVGRLAGSRSYNAGIALSRTLEWLRRINTYIGYRRQESTNFTSQSSDFLNDKLLMGLRFSLIGQLYYYLNTEYNSLEEKFTGNRSYPQALETGFDWSGQIFNNPLFYGNLHCIYRDEEHTMSPLSFLSGEDYLEGYAELSYRPNPDKELYCSGRLRNVWASNPNINKRVEADFRVGMRYLWDTGIRWESIGAVEGYVFKDFNSDGLRQKDEPPVAGVKIWLGKDKSQITDVLGYYKFGKVKARKVYLNIDTTTIPSGFILTAPATQEVLVAHGQAVRADFGIASRSEIVGIVFEDVDGDNQLGVKDLPMRGVVLILEDGTRTTTDAAGRYFFRKTNVGKHTLTLDLNSLPPNYLPSVPIFKDLELFEGISYIYNIPLRKTQI
jgi:hypothetical protein